MIFLVTKCYIFLDQPVHWKETKTSESPNDFWWVMPALGKPDFWRKNFVMIAKKFFVTKYEMEMSNG